MARARRRPRRSVPWPLGRRGLRRGLVRRCALPAAIAALVGVNAYVFLGSDTSLPKLLQASTAARGALSPSAARPTAPPPVAAPASRVIDGAVASGDTLDRILRRTALAPADVTALLAALQGVLDHRQVRPGQRYRLTLDSEDRVERLHLRLSPQRAVLVERGEGDRLVARHEEEPIDVQVAEVGGVIESSLYEAIDAAGESTSLIGFFVDVFSWDIDFFTDTQRGDRFRVVVEKQYLGGRFYRYGKVLAAEYAGRVGTFRAFHFRSPDGRAEGYYDEQGRNIVKSLLKTPLKFVRVSSGFDRRRFHPVLHTTRAHLGIDYAAPVGTPVGASATGRVAFAGSRSGSGNTVILTHPSGMQTLYYHLSRIARGVRPGASVRQKEVIGYVGSTGLSTGPHLHFAIKVGGAFVDPTKMKVTREAPLPAAYRQQFLSTLAPRLAALDRVPAQARIRPPAFGPSPPL